MVGRLKIADQTRETNNGFRKFTDYESYINAIDEYYEPEDAIINGYI